MTPLKKVSSLTTDPRCMSLLTAAAGVVLLAAHGYAQAIPTANASAISPLPVKVRSVAEDRSIRPFRINVPEGALVDLRRRIATTRWPDRHGH